VIDDDVLAPGVLVAPHDLIGFQDFFAGGTPLLVADGRMAHSVQLAEGNVPVFRGGVNFDGDMDESERDGAAPEGPHGRSPPQCRAVLGVECRPAVVPGRSQARSCRTWPW